MKCQALYNACMGRRFVRFLIGGVWNTVFSYALFCVLYYLFSGHLHYLVIQTVCVIVGVTNAFICQRIFVFRSRGNILTEYLKFYLIYSMPIAMSYLLLPLLIDGAHINAYSAKGIVTGISVFGSYIGHKYFTFRNGIK